MDGTIGALLHDVALHKFAGSDVALRAVARVRAAQQVISGASIAAHDVMLTEQILAGRQGMLALASQRLRTFAREVGYPELMTAALSVDAKGCATRSPDTANPQEAVLAELCHEAIGDADHYAVGAITWAFARLGAPYACKGVGRDHPLFQFDCSSFVSRAYHDGAGIPLLHGANIPTTATMLAGSGRFAPVDVSELAPGDLVLYDSCPAVDEAEDAAEIADGSVEFVEALETCTDRHVVMYLGTWQGKEWMVHTSRCGGVANVDHFWGLGEDAGRIFLGVVRVQRP
jgi:cell wall-associated NlpC family hydrolase